MATKQVVNKPTMLATTRHDPDRTRPTVVIFHPNATTCDGMHLEAMHYYRGEGYDVTCPNDGRLSRKRSLLLLHQR